MLQLNRILVPTDFSEGSQQALDLAVELAQANNARIDILHVFEEPAFPSFYGAGALLLYGQVPDIRKEAQKALDQMGDSIKTRVPAVGAHLVDGHAVRGIVSFADEHDTDLIVIASHGLTGLQHVLLGSVAESVVRQAPCPVFVVKAHGKSMLSAED